MKLKQIILILLMPLSEIKALFYNSDKNVDWYLFADHKRYLCNVIEDYTQIIVMGVILFYLAFIEIDNQTRKVVIFLFVVNAIDMLFLSLIDLQVVIILKLSTALLLTKWILSKL